MSANATIFSSEANDFSHSPEWELQLGCFFPCVSFMSVYTEGNRFGTPHASNVECADDAVLRRPKLRRLFSKTDVMEQCPGFDDPSIDYSSFLNHILCNC